MGERLCNKCGKPGEFHQRKPGVLHGVCKACMTAYQKTYYGKTKNRYVATRKASKINRRREFRRIIDEFKNRPCADCRKSWPSFVMDLDHLDPKTKIFSIGAYMSRGIGIDALLAEIAKCEAVCANCHRIRTHSRSVA